MTRLETLADPLRLEIVHHLERHGDASPAELADAAGVHLNTVRPHLAELEADGALERVASPPAGRGRPALRYRLVPGWTLPSTDFRGLAEVLAAALARRGASADEVHEVGVAWGRRLGDQDVPVALERLGFDARVEDGRLELASCPCPLVLPDHPELICELAVAVAEGVSGVPVGSRHHDPERRSCNARLVTA
jgi:DNA-binding transcriptional ArsR family regulator